MKSLFSMGGIHGGILGSKERSLLGVIGESIAKIIIEIPQIATCTTFPGMILPTQVLRYPFEKVLLIELLFTICLMHIGFFLRPCWQVSHGL